MRGFVYTIRAPGSDLIYYGSTIQSLSQRIAGHRRAYKQHLAGKNVGYCFSYQLLALNEAYIELVRVVEFNVKAELLAAEGALIRENECVNKRQAGRTMAQYRLDNTETIKAQEAAYRAANIEKINEKHDCRCGGCYTTNGKSTHIKTARHQAWLATQ